MPEIASVLTVAVKFFIRKLPLRKEEIPGGAKVFPLFVIIFLSILAATTPLMADNSPGRPINQPASLSSAIKRISSLLTKKGLSKLPSASQALSSRTSSSSILTSAAVSGTPPLLPTIPDLPIRNLFWREGVVAGVASGTPTQGQCAEFFSSPIDGNSGGLGACHLAEAVGRSFQTTLDAETSLCYIKNFPSKANLDAGGITVNSGKVTGNNIAKLFLATEKTRTVKINAPAFRQRGQLEAIFVKIFSTEANEKAERLYRADLYFCPPGQPGPRGFNSIQISDKGAIKIIIRNRVDPFNGGGNTIELKGNVKADSGSIIWDPTKSRTLDLRIDKEDDVSKDRFEITNQGLVLLKRRDVFQNSLLKEYMIARFTGTDALNVSFLEGAFKGESLRNSRVRSYSGATEYRDTFYTSAPQNTFRQQADSFSISGDSFYDADAVVDVNTDSYSCNAKVVAELTMNEGNATLESALDPCFNNRLQKMDFCRSNQLIKAAESNFIDACVNRQPPP